jgi:hypothetical protein
MTVGITQFFICTFRTVTIILAKDNSNFFDVFKTWIYVLWFVSCVSATALGYMVLRLSFEHLLMMCTNATTLDAKKKKAPPPLPFI